MFGRAVRYCLGSCEKPRLGDPSDPAVVELRRAVRSGAWPETWAGFWPVAFDWRYLRVNGIVFERPEDWAEMIDAMRTATDPEIAAQVDQLAIPELPADEPERDGPRVVVLAGVVDAAAASSSSALRARRSPLDRSDWHIAPARFGVGRVAAVARDARSAIATAATEPAPPPRLNMIRRTNLDRPTIAGDFAQRASAAEERMRNPAPEPEPFPRSVQSISVKRFHRAAFERFVAPAVVPPRSTVGLEVTATGRALRPARQ